MVDFRIIVSGNGYGREGFICQFLELKDFLFAINISFCTILQACELKSFYLTKSNQVFVIPINLVNKLFTAL